MKQLGPVLSVWLLTACTAPPGVSPAPELTEVWAPVPPRVTPGEGGGAPSDAVVLFDGTGLDAWRTAADPAKPAQWTVANGIMTIAPGSGHIATARSFTDYQLHLEWQIPDRLGGKGQQRGNSGVFLASTGTGSQGYELQILGCDDNPTYANGQAASIYKQHLPLANACAPAGQWQRYDVVWTAPRFDGDGTLLSAARVTVLHNGVLVQNDVALAGQTVYQGAPFYRVHGALPLKLQDHGDAVNFRNIWLRPLLPR
jgi:hypothetical protein